MDIIALHGDGKILYDNYVVLQVENDSPNRRVAATEKIRGVLNAEEI
jgi:hypothetical protein